MSSHMPTTPPDRPRRHECSRATDMPDRRTINRIPQTVPVGHQSSLEWSSHQHAGRKVAITITRQGGDKFLAGSGHTMDKILKLAGENQPLPKFPLDRKS